MSTTITGKLNKAANEFQAGESVGFGVRVGVQYYDRETKQKEWTNYSAVIFAKAPGQIQFYRDVLIEGAVIEVIAEQAKVDVYQGSNGPMYSIDLLNARLGFTHTPQGQQAPRQAQQGQQQYQPQQNQAPQQNGGFDDFDDVPFNQP